MRGGGGGGLTQLGGMGDSWLLIEGSVFRMNEKLMLDGQTDGRTDGQS